MKLKIYPKLVYRISQFPTTEDLEYCWEELKDSIRISSNDFYQKIQFIQADELSQLPEKIYSTIWKYFNRARFRSTPYGSFAGVGTIPLSTAFNSSTTTISPVQTLHRFVDWQCKEQLSLSFEQMINRDSFLFTNSSYYRIGDDIRYVRNNEGNFELADIESDNLLSDILNLCNHPIRISDIINRIGTEPEFVLSTLEDLIALQLLVADQYPNIIGEDYFQRIDSKGIIRDKEYIIAERPLINGGINPELVKHLPGLLERLQRILPVNENQRLQEFINRFSRKFEQTEIPLMKALDPELGVGYDDLEQATGSTEFINKLMKIPNVQAHGENLRETIIKEISQSGSNCIESIDISAFKTETSDINTDTKLPNTISLLCSIVDEQLLFEHVGGATANALLGRFTLASDEIFSVCKDLAGIEAAANKDVLFFDIGYISENKVDNINRRKSIYDYQLNILAYDTSIDPLTLDDLYISVHGNNVVLRSKRLNKRVVPRLATAYNFQRSDLAVFKLLCDLQAQSLQADLNFSIMRILPGLDYYPQLVYKNIIISRRSWRLSFHEHGADITSLKSALRNIGVSDNIKTGLADQTLRFNIHVDTDLFILLEILKKEKHIYVEEVIVPNHKHIQDTDARAYHGEFIISLYHEDKIYNGIKSWNMESETQVQKFFLPGQDWLYFEIFCHASRADGLLAEKISAFLNDNAESIDKCFFIRYTESGHHIRLRLKLFNPGGAFTLSASLYKHLDYELENGLVSEICLKTYKREIERYGAHLINQVEKHFTVDSRYVLNIIQSMPSEMDRYMLCIYVIGSIESRGVFEGETFNNLIEKLTSSYNREHRFTATEYKILNEQYQQLHKRPFPILSELVSEFLNKFINSLIDTLWYSDKDARGRLFSDLIHMHVNRLFDTNQRLHEGVIYYFVYKTKLKEIASRKTGLLS